MTDETDAKPNTDAVEDQSGDTSSILGGEDTKVETSTIDEGGKPDEGAADEGDKSTDADNDGATDDGESDDEPKGAPEEYAEFQLELPEGMKVDEQMLEAFKPYAKEKNFTQAEAQEFVDMYAKVQAESYKNAMQAQVDEQAQWVDDVKALPDFKGEKYEAAASLSTSAVKQFGGPNNELADFLNETGLGNNPLLVSAFYRIGKAMGEDSFEEGGSTTGEVDTATLLYPDEAN